eukprot:6201778-Pleurochrysis_carterae.AAC.1
MAPLRSTRAAFIGRSTQLVSTSLASRYGSGRAYSSLRPTAAIRSRLVVCFRLAVAHPQEALISIASVQLAHLLRRPRPRFVYDARFLFRSQLPNVCQAAAGKLELQLQLRGNRFSAVTYSSFDCVWSPRQVHLACLSQIGGVYARASFFKSVWRQPLLRTLLQSPG